MGSRCNIINCLFHWFNARWYNLKFTIYNGRLWCRKCYCMYVSKNFLDGSFRFNLRINKCCN